MSSKLLEKMRLESEKSIPGRMDSKERHGVTDNPLMAPHL